MKRFISSLCMELILLLVLISDSLCARSEFSKPDGSDSVVPAVEHMILDWGYPVETHVVTTDDKYLLTVFRLPNSGSPVFLQHGILASSMNYLANKKGLPYFLHDKGYDVWVGNARGTRFSKGHKTYTTYKAEYWDFSFHEMGFYDIPAVLKHIHDTTGNARVHYVAHSMGTTMFMVMAATQSEPMELVHSVTFMAPVARPKHMGMIEAAVKRKIIHMTTKALPAVGVPSYQYSKGLAATVYRHCGRGKTVLGRMCQRYMKQINPIEFEFFQENAKNMYWWYFDGTSFKNHRHFLQIAEAGKFQQFDYENRNLKVYNSKKPPVYDLSKISKRIYILSGGKDDIAQKEDIKWLHHRLKDSWLITENFVDFDHSSFNFGSEISKVHKTVGDIIDAAENGKEPELQKENPLPPTDLMDDPSSEN